ncbi:MAG TPA: hypothetical protein VE709_08600 [Pseudonocardiaceae bacterium]|jgi:hypothetical protein|nr:hypothetical protein [Pseudonocardiaceae bacterium]
MIERVSSAAPGGRRRPPIADYGFLSDCHTAALVDRAGSVDSWCAPDADALVPVVGR